ncbi:hypothetical protein [Brachybacterium saurashtrense]|uniref:Uncharacterized protein n=1 Tax=Brachybacterium saurashtrense TaxID=556288 RepID=A0A345YSZ2_9MICO|nr:hypothetical protein [Brachybacterium saurashtrense]AXK47044.1 hypothetical protein DWV08_16405 [Brachybacterium saurashtrense]RRR20893.1 hypothetical protein DXU92_16300 [Brachybacterium saurashtrense]
MLERESRRRDGLPCGTPEEREVLERWKDLLARSGAVVEYVPETAQGFVLVHAQEVAGEDLIRRPGPR